MKLPFKKKKSVLDERISRLRRELAAVDGEMRSLSKGLDESGVPQLARPPARYRRRQEPPWESEPPAVAESPAPDKSQKPVTHERSPEEIKRMYEKRFADYLASSFQQIPPLRHERSIQRNKALFMVAFVIVILFLLVRLLF